MNKINELYTQLSTSMPEIKPITSFKENIDTIKNISIGSYIEVEINLYSKEYNDKYFHNVQAWKITLLDNEETPF